MVNESINSATPMLAEENGGISAERRYGPNNRSQEEEVRYAESSAPEGLSLAEAERRLEAYGLNMLEEKDVNECLNFLSYFWGPMPIMIWVAVIVEIARQDWLDFGVLFFLQVLNGVVGYYEEKNAGDAIAALKASLAPKCNVKRDGVNKIIDAKYLVPGDVVNIKLGDIVPADCKLLTGPPLEVDQSALTGESLPVTIYSGEQIKMGSTIKRGEIEAVVCFTGSNTFFGKAAEMVNSVEMQGRFQRIMFNVTMFLFALSTVLCTIILIVLLTSHVGALAAIGVVVVLLVASIPIAMQVVSTSTMAVGSRRLAEKKVIVAKLSAIEELAGMDMLCSDKTGTLTQNKLQLFDPVVLSNVAAPDLVFLAALAAKRIAEGQDAIDFCICNAVEPSLAGNFGLYEELDFIPFDPVIKRTEATVRCPDGTVMRVTKGAPQVVLRMAHNYHEIEAQTSAAVQSLADRGYRSLGLAVNRSAKDGKWEMLGVLSLFDPPRIDTAETLRTAMDMGIEVKMITGDQTAIAKETCRSLGMGTNILNTEVLNGQAVEGVTGRLADIVREADGFAEVLPEHKFQIVEILQKQDLVVGMTGDGVNDAPALKRAHIGIAVEGATDAARAAADIVLTEPGLSVIIDAIIRSRKIFQRVRNYCIYRIACTIQLVFFFFFAVLSLTPSTYFCYEDDPSRVIKGSVFSDCDFSTRAPSSGPLSDCAVNATCSPLHDADHQTYEDVDTFYPYYYPGAKYRFTLPVLALVIITILNDGTIITIARDKVVPNHRPQSWRLKEVYMIAAVLGFIPCISSFLLLLAGMNTADGLYPSYDYLLGSKVAGDGDDYFLKYEQLLTVIYLKISVSDFLTVFAARTRGPFFERRPGYALLCAFVVATLTSTLIATQVDLPDDTYKMMSIPWRTAGYIWLYNLVWFVIQDACKVMVYRIFEKYNIGQEAALASKAQHVQMSNAIETEHHGSRAVATDQSLRSSRLTSEFAAARSGASNHSRSHQSLTNLRASADPHMSAVLERLAALERDNARLPKLEEEVTRLRARLAASSSSEEKL